MKFSSRHCTLPYQTDFDINNLFPFPSDPFSENRSTLAAARIKAFIRAMDHDARSGGRTFPTWCEVLEVLQSLGYSKPTNSDITTSTQGRRLAIVKEMCDRMELARTLRQFGGVRMTTPTQVLYEFNSSHERDAAIDWVRMNYGWTAAEPRL